MNKKIILIITILVIIILAISFIWRQNQNKDNEEYFPLTSTQQERDDAKKLPKEDCPCWDGSKNICLPQADCI